jgi:hypothetical protein
MRFASADPARRRLILSALQERGISVHRSDVEDLGELYLVRSGPGITGAREAITCVLNRRAPGWESDVEFFWPG